MTQTLAPHKDLAYYLDLSFPVQLSHQSEDDDEYWLAEILDLPDAWRTALLRMKPWKAWKKRNGCGLRLRSKTAIKYPSRLRFMTTVGSFLFGCRSHFTTD